jgi:hypothetical protein
VRRSTTAGSAADGLPPYASERRCADPSALESRIIEHLLRRSKSQSLTVDVDLWLCALDLAVSCGWQPRGTKPALSEEETDFDPWTYTRADGRRILAADARSLAQGLSLAIAGVSDSVVPLGGKPFGNENTAALLARAAKSESIDPDEAQAAREILSGPPKSDAYELIGFLRRGGFALLPPPQRSSK